MTLFAHFSLSFEYLLDRPCAPKQCRSGPSSGLNSPHTLPISAVIDAHLVNPSENHASHDCNRLAETYGDLEAAVDVLAKGHRERREKADRRRRGNHRASDSAGRGRRIDRSECEHFVAKNEVSVRSWKRLRRSSPRGTLSGIGPCRVVQKLCETGARSATAG